MSSSKKPTVVLPVFMRAVNDAIFNLNCALISMFNEKDSDEFRAAFEALEKVCYRIREDNIEFLTKNTGK